MSKRQPSPKRHPDDAVVAAIRGAIEPMHKALTGQYERWMKLSADSYDRLIAEARKEVEDAIAATPRGPGESVRWQLPAWMGTGVHLYHQTAVKAFDEAARYIDPYHLAMRKFGSGTRQFYFYRDLLAQDAGFSKNRKTIPSMAAKMAEERIRATVNKLALKVEGQGRLNKSSVFGSTPDNFRLYLEFAAGTLELSTKMITNYSVHQKPYAQWPTLIYRTVGGERTKVSEKELRAIKETKS